MGLVLCPECNAKISDKAVACPHCGYVSENRGLPISAQHNCVPIPKFKCSIQEWSPSSDQELSLESFDDNKKLFDFFGNIDNIRKFMPGIAEVIDSLVKSNHVLIARVPKYVQELIDNGTYRFMIDKNGEILPAIRDAKGIVKQVRLEDAVLKSPELVHSLSNLSIQIMMNQILSEIQSISDSIRSIQIDMQNDRLALADSAMQSIQQAFLIKDISLRDFAILDCIHKATEAKCTLMRNFQTNYSCLKNAQKQNALDFIKGMVGSDKTLAASNDAKSDLISIMNSMRVECMGYGALGEYESERKCLSQFKAFIKDNRLTDKNTLRLINEGLEKKETDFVDQFTTISNRISNFEKISLLDNEENILLIGGKINGRD